VCWLLWSSRRFEGKENWQETEDGKGGVEVRKAESKGLGEGGLINNKIQGRARDSDHLPSLLLALLAAGWALLAAGCWPFFLGQTKARADSARDSDHLPSLLLALLAAGWALLAAGCWPFF
jgi:hypothetical protein